MTNAYRFLLTPRWLGGTALALAAATVCLWLGTWQLGRFHEKAAATRPERARPAVESVALDALLTDRQPLVRTDTAGRTVTATGRWDNAHQLLVPNRTVDGSQGYYVLTPLRTDTGRAVAVVRGWTAGAPGSAAPPPDAPDGPVTVTGRLHPPENSGKHGAVAGGLPAGQLGTISPAALVNLLPYALYDGWVAADAAPAGLTPVAALPAQAGTGLTLKSFQNLGYTGEWFVFAGFVLFMWCRLARREAEATADRDLDLGPDQDPAPAWGGRRTGPRRRRRILEWSDGYRGRNRT
ncbi:SURF1 family protein [Kitasatospora sp. A2-31]|uniref:SURF1 family protein n=1 Tax=Kitasatospora sp. A2-31 TaxID=2916414 RepID=UPI001EEC70EC|nr:SURF1 family protein [Kitasatospora sp. A2-31]MCG6498320.1 SURF1 family protein [Kitasatospora sp. A2-31]